MVKELLYHDALYDVGMSKRKASWLDSEWDEVKQLVEEEDTECGYREYLSFILGKIELNAHNKRKREDANLIDEGDDYDGSNDYDPQYAIEGELMSDAEVSIQRDEGQLSQMPRRRYKRVTEILRGQSFYHGQQDEKDKLLGQVYLQKLDEGNLQQLDKGKNEIHEDDRADRKPIVHKEILHQKLRQQNNWLIQYHEEHVDQAGSDNNHRGTTGGIFKGKNKVKVEDNANQKTMVKIDHVNFFQGRRSNLVPDNYSESVDKKPDKKEVVHGQRVLMKVGQGDHELTRKAAFVNCSVKNEPNDGFSVNTSPFSETYKNGVENNLIKAGNVETYPEVEILDSVPFANGVLSSFVPSMTYNEVFEFQGPDCPNAVDEFRKEVIKVLRKPFDKKEHKQHKEAIRAGSYLHYYPDLRKKLKTNRYRRQKCLALLRGFFFWLKSVTRPGVFRPWNDPQCLGVEARPPIRKIYGRARKTHQRLSVLQQLPV